MSHEKFNELAFYTLSQTDPFFIHQLAVDAFAAQTADERTKNITLVFAVVGLYLFVEKDFTGKQVQDAHVKLSRFKDQLPEIILPVERGSITIDDVLKAENKTNKIKAWSRSVWGSFKSNQSVVEAFFSTYL